MIPLKKNLSVLVFISLGALAACGDDRGNGGGSGNNAATNNNTGTNNTGTNNNTPADATTQLKDLSPDEVAALCITTTQKDSDFDNPASDTGKAGCLVESAYDAYDEEDSDEDNIDFCETFLEECLEEQPYDPTTKCMDPTDCTATVAEFEACSADSLVAYRALITPFMTKTCSDLATESGIESVYELFDTVPDVPSCDALFTKCPDL